MKKEQKSAAKVATESKKLRGIKETQASHKEAKINAKSLGACLTWVKNNNKEFSELASIAMTKENYKILAETVKPNMKTGTYNSYAVTLALRKLEFIFS